MRQYTFFYQGMKFKQFLLLIGKRKTRFKCRTHNYLISPRAKNAASDTKGFFRSNVHLSQVDLSAERKTQTLYEYLDTHKHVIKELPSLTHTHRMNTLRAWQLPIHPVLLSGQSAIPHLYSYSFLIFFYSPLHSHCNSKGRAQPKLTPTL